MKALVYERNVTRYAVTKVLGKLTSPKASLSPLRLVEIDPPQLPNQDWVAFTPLLSGICGSDLATITSSSSRYFEDIVSFPFTMGHEVVGEYMTEAGHKQRAVLIPTLNCQVRNLNPMCRYCQMGETQRCQMLQHGSISAGLQTGFCADTSGGWSQGIIAHKSQLFDIGTDITDESAVLFEPFACAIHAALSIDSPESTIAVIGGGTLGLLTIAALKAIYPDCEIIATARYEHQKLLAQKMGANIVTDEKDLYRQARSIRSAQMISAKRPTDGFGIVFDAVGSSSSIEQALNVAAPGATIVLVGMPEDSKLDLTPLWMKELTIRGSYAYGLENIEGKKVSTFELAERFAKQVDLSDLLSATYRLDDYEMAIDHASNAGRRGGVKIAFDMRKLSTRENWSRSR